MPHELTENKIVILKCLLILRDTTNPFLDQIVMKVDFV